MNSCGYKYLIERKNMIFICTEVYIVLYKFKIMENSLNNGFYSLSTGEMETINAGGWRQFGHACGGVLLIAGSPIVATIPGAGLIAAGEMLGGGIIMLGGCK